MTPSQQQLAIREAYAASRRSLFIRASAGAGKTSTGVWLCKEVVPQGEKTVFLAFGTDIAEELEARLPYWITSSTFHRACSKSVREHLAALTADRRWPTIDKDKCKNILAEVVPEWKERREIQGDVLRLVSLGKANGTGALPDAPTIADLRDEIGALEDAIEPARVVLHRSNQKHSVIDFDDMLYLPLLHNIPLPKCRNLFIDEAQDTNPVQMELINRMLFPGGRIVAIGDPMQAIYGFRGASTAAVDELIRRFDMQLLPLSVSFRCSRAVVRETLHHINNPKPQRRRRESSYPQTDEKWANAYNANEQLNTDEDERPY